MGCMFSLLRTKQAGLVVDTKETVSDLEYGLKRGPNEAVGTSERRTIGSETAQLVSGHQGPNAAPYS